MYTYPQNDIQSNDNDFQEDQRAYNTVRAMFGFFAQFMRIVPYQVLQLRDISGNVGWVVYSASI